ncbi:hypothetical protein J4458_05460 [Candidatus Woesearchaeota archaeon]|nr:hypothetical protein [Candidatus Woesearchaeota archaeon]
MDELVRKDAISVLSEVIGILKVKEEKDAAEIRELSNHTIHNASVFQDEASVSIAILIYSLSKIIERMEWELDYKPILSLLENAKELLENNKFDDYNKSIKKLFALISNIDSKLKLYIEEVINQAQIKKGGKLYEHGISVARAAEVLGISQWELMGYIGKTKLTEDIQDIVDLRSRLKFARGLFE